MKRKVLVSFIAFSVFILSGGGQIAAKDIFSELMKDSIATFTDAGMLLYYSVVNVGTPDKTPKNLNITESVSPAEVQKLLAARGIEIELQSRPIKRKEFAKTIMKHFALSTGFLTSLLGTSDMYFKDAISLGLFSRETSGEGNLSTKELLQVYLRAESIRN